MVHEPEIQALFLVRVDMRAGSRACWPWTGARIREAARERGVFHVGDGTQALAHRVSWEIAHGVAAGESVIRHSCDNPMCVNPAHLIAGTQAENVADMFARGRANRPRGERALHSKLTESAVLAIRSEYTGRRGEQLALAAKYGVTRSALCAIVNRKTWRHVQ